MNIVHRILRMVAACRSLRLFPVVMLLILGPSAAFGHGDPGKPVSANSPSSAASRPKTSDIIDIEPESAAFDETSAFVNVPRIGGLELPVVIRDRMVFLPVAALFDFLKIQSRVSGGLDSVSGYFIEPAQPYCIDGVHYTISYRGTVLQLRDAELMRASTGLFLREDKLAAIFGLNCVFDSRNLTVRVTTDYELPAARIMQQELMRRNVSRIRGDVRADTSVGRSGTGAHFGTLDWTLNATEFSSGQKDYRINLGLGGMIAGGEATVRLNLNNRDRLDQRQQFYQWRYVNNEQPGLRQINLGRIFPQTTASIFDPIVGAQVSNTPTTYRRSFGTYRLSRTTQPGWTVELYVNNVLVDYAKADASGFFAFDVPMVYGRSQVKLRFYGPYGEERSTEETITIPFNFLPKGEYEYLASAGMVLDTLSSRFARAGVNYGLSSRITIGAGTEYLSSIKNRPTMPFVNASMRLSSNLMLSADYTHGVRGRATLSYRLPYSVQLELNYARLSRDQRAIVFNNLEERRASVSMPLRSRNFFGLTRLMYTQYLITNRTRYTTAEWLLSANLSSFSANVNTYLIHMQRGDPARNEPFVYSNFSLSYRFAKGYRITPEAQYSFTERQMISMRCELEKYLFHRGFLNLSFERNLRANTYSVGAGLRYDLSFGRVGLAFRRFNNLDAFNLSAAGSLVVDAKTRLAAASYRPAVGRGGITLRAFLDLNGDGRYDAGEPLVAGLRARSSTGRVAASEQDTLLRIFELEPWANAFVDLSQSSFDNAGWALRFKTFSVLVEANLMKVVDVPVEARSEASGIVRMRAADGSLKPAGIRICAMRTDGSPAGCAGSEGDGFYNLSGLRPGTYSLRPDAAQLESMGLQAHPAVMAITILPKAEGAVLDGLDFELR